MVTHRHISRTCANEAKELYKLCFLSAWFISVSCLLFISSQQKMKLDCKGCTGLIVCFASNCWHRSLITKDSTEEGAGLGLPSWLCWCQPVFWKCQSEALVLICCELLWQSESTVTAGESAVPCPTPLAPPGELGHMARGWDTWPEVPGNAQPTHSHTLPGYGFRSIHHLGGTGGRAKN